MTEETVNVGSVIPPEEEKKEEVKVKEEVKKEGSEESTLVKLKELQQKIKDEVAGNNFDEAVKAIKELHFVDVTRGMLKDTCIHRECLGYVKHANQDVSLAAKTLVALWKVKFPPPPSSAAAGGGSLKKTESGSSTNSNNNNNNGDNNSNKASKKREEPDTSSPSASSAKKQLKKEDSVASSVASDEGGLWKSSGDARRDKFQLLLKSALDKHFREGDMDPGNVAYRIEAALFNHFGAMNDGYTKQFKSVKFNLSDPKNLDFARRFLEGDLAPSSAPTLTSHDMASEEKRVQKQKAVEREIWESSSWDMEKSYAVTDAFRCGKCGNRKCTFYQKQTRSADEPMTTFVTCIPCGNRWRFC